MGGKVVATERIYPAGDGAIAWIEVNTDNVGTNHYLRVDDPYGSYNDASSDTLYANAGNVDIYTMANVAAMGAGDTATDLTVYLRIQSPIGSSETMQVSYSLNGTDWTQIGTNIVLNEISYTEYTRTVSGLSLSQGDVNNLQIKIQRTAGSNDIRISALSVLVTYTEAGGSAIPVFMHHLNILAGN